MPHILIPTQARGTTGTKRQNSEVKAAFAEIRSAHKRQKAENRKRRSYRDASTISVPTARLIIETLPTVQKPSIRSIFGALGGTEVRDLPAHRLSPRQGRRLRRRGVKVVAQAVAILQAENARLAAKARDKAVVEAKSGIKVQCSARTKIGTQCRKASVADGYCATHGA